MFIFFEKARYDLNCVKSAIKPLLTLFFQEMWLCIFLRIFSSNVRNSSASSHFSVCHFDLCDSKGA